MTELELMANEEARHGDREALERMEAELRGAYLSEMVALGQAQEAYEAQKKAEAKLAKALDALARIVRGDDDARNWAIWTLAELTGGKDE